VEEISSCRLVIIFSLLKVPVSGLLGTPLLDSFLSILIYSALALELDCFGWDLLDCFVLRPGDSVMTLPFIPDHSNSQEFLTLETLATLGEFSHSFTLVVLNLSGINLLALD